MRYAAKKGFEVAHQLHSGTCGCNLPVNKHKTTCTVFKEFNNFLIQSKTENSDDAFYNIEDQQHWVIDDVLAI